MLSPHRVVADPLPPYRRRRRLTREQLIGFIGPRRTSPEAWPEFDEVDGLFGGYGDILALAGAGETCPSFDLQPDASEDSLAFFRRHNESMFESWEAQQERIALYDRKRYASRAAAQQARWEEEQRRRRLAKEAEAARLWQAEEERRRRAAEWEEQRQRQRAAERQQAEQRRQQAQQRAEVEQQQRARQWAEVERRRAEHLEQVRAEEARRAEEERRYSENVRRYWADKTSSRDLVHIAVPRACRMEVQDYAGKRHLVEFPAGGHQVPPSVARLGVLLGLWGQGLW